MSQRNKEGIVDRIFLFGIRQLIIVILIIIAGVYFTIYGATHSAVGDLIGGVLLILLGFGIGLALRATAIRRIRKRYYNVQDYVGKTGVARSTFDSRNKGVVLVENEYWSAITTSTISEGDEIKVTGVEPDRVTLRVEKK
ncbi:MAG: NfeD family protein [Methanomassiliicoccales archaeon]